LRIIYHHRTRSTDAQRVHILEMVGAFQSLGHEVELVSLIPTDRAQHDAERDAGNPLWQRLARRTPFVYEAIQLAYNLAGVPMLLWKLCGKKTDLIYERYSLFNWSGSFASKFLGIPLVLEVNSPFALEQGRDNDIRLVKFAAWTERTICNLATRIIVVSTPLSRILENSGVRRELIEVMMNGVRPEHFHPKPQSQRLRSSLGLRSGERVIGFVGWFRKWHGIELLLEAFRLSGLQDHNIRLLLIGDGQAMADLKQYVREKNLSEGVIFTGPLPHARIPEYLDLIDIAVQPAANEYCCPMKILEYMALSKPIVAPRQPNIQELLREGEEAQYFEPNNASSLAEALKMLAHDPAMAERIGRNAQNAISTRGLLWTANAKRVVEMIMREKPAFGAR
jgi:glycosyltransferase involved in cell wall biosynthesis